MAFSSDHHDFSCVSDAIFADDRNNPDDTPGKRVRQQTGDVITLLRALQVLLRNPARRSSTT